MKRIARLATDKFIAADALSGHSDLIQVLKRHLPPGTVALFAKPKTVDGGLTEWYSDLGGQPVPLSDLPPAQAEQVKRLLDERLDSIQQLATRLESQGVEGQQQAALLRQAARYPDISTVYSLNGQPVLTFWGYGLRPPTPPPGAADPGGMPVSALNADAPVPPLPPTVSVEAKKRRRWWPWWLLALLLLGLLAALLWWLFCPEEATPPPQQPPAIEAPVIEAPVIEAPAIEAPAVTEQAEVAPEPEPEIKPEPEPDPMDLLSQKVAAAPKDCQAIKKLLANEPLLKSSDARALALKQQLNQNLQKNCKQQLIKEAKNLCPNERPKELAPELIIVFDASGSMDFSLNASREDIAQAEASIRQLGQLGPMGQIVGAMAGLAAQERLTREPKRITHARQATLSVVQRIPQDVNVGLVLVERCPGARSAGYFSPAQRSNLLGQIQAIRPMEGTPLADGVARAGQMLDGVNKESIMLVVSDGEESCNMDPCAIAAQLARSKPHLKINVVDIMGTGAGNCLAQATGGKVYTANNVNELSIMTTQAAQDVLGPARCQHP